MPQVRASPSPIDARRATTDPTDLHRAAVDLVRDWHPDVRRIVAEADVDATFPVRVTSARTVSPWTDPAVTLLGDAVHTMSPGRGDGANVALRDAQVFTQALVRAAAGELSLAPAKRAYEVEMLDYGFAAVAASRERPFSRPAPQHRPV